MATQNTKKAVVDAHNAKTAVGFFNGTFDYPSSKGLGIDVINCERRNPHPQERTPLPVKIKMRDLPHSITRDLRDAARVGELKQELGRHIALLEKGSLADKSTISLLRGYQSDLSGHAGYDRDQMDAIEAVVLSLAPKEG